MVVLHVTNELEPLKRIGQLARWVRENVDGGKVLLLGFEGRRNLNGIEVVGGGLPPRVAVSDVVEEAFMELFTTLAELPYKLDPRNVSLVEGHEWRGGLAAYIIAKRLRVPFRFSIYTREEERGGQGLVSEAIKSIESFLMSSADEVFERLKNSRFRRESSSGFQQYSNGGFSILHASWEYPPHMVGGLGRAVTSMAKRLTSYADVFVATIGLPGRVHDERAERLKVMRVDPFSLRSTGLVSWVYAFNALIVAKVLTEGVKPSIIHAHDWLTAPAAVALKHLLRAPLVVTIHATEYGRSRGNISTSMQQQIHYWEWRLTYEAWRVFVCSNSMRGEVEAAFKLPRDKVIVLPNGIDLEEFDAFKPEHGERDNYALPWEKIVFFTGRHVYDKGVDLLIECARILLQRRSDVKFVISGDGPMRMHLEWLARSYGLGDKVLFTGRLPDNVLYKVMKLADVIVIPSRYEPFGIVALEAMAAAKPIVATQIGGLAELVKEGETGVLVPPESPEALAVSIERLLDNPELAKDMGLKGRKRVEELYGWGKIVRYLFHIYGRVLEEYASSGWKTLFDSSISPPQLKR